MPQGWDFGALGVPMGSKKISNMVMWHIIYGDDKQNSNIFIYICNILYRIFILLPESCPGVGLVGAGGSQKL